MSNTRVTVASTNARIDGIESALVALTQAVTGLVAQFATPAAVAETVASAPKARKATKAAPKALVSVPTGKAVTATVSVDEARALVEAGGDAWKIKVTSTSGNAIPFGMVLRAERAAARKSETPVKAAKAPAKAAPKAAPKAKASKSTKASTEAAEMFKLGGAALKALAADGNKAAQAEIDRRASK